MAGKRDGLKQFLSLNMMKVSPTRFKNFNKSYYTTGSYEDYLQRFEEEGQDFASRIIKKLKPSPSWRFLDVGCGMGGVVLALRKLGFEAWGTEVSPYCLRHSPAKDWLIYADIRRLPFENNSFEIVSCADVLCYLTREETGGAIKELSRVTSNYVYLETICRGSPNNSQRLNPDSLREDRYLLTPESLRNLLVVNQLGFVESFFNPEEEIDFNGIFRKIRGREGTKKL
jgi:SAM-dependent methyltransferase